MHSAETISQQIDDVTQEADASFEIYETHRQALADVKMMKYERRELETGEVVFIPLEVLMDELMQAEVESGKLAQAEVESGKRAQVESGRFVTKLTGRTSKEERAAELEGWMRQYIPLYSEYSNRLQNQEVQETMASAASAIAEKNCSRLHTKIMALRGQLEFLTASENTSTASQEIDTIKEQKKAQIILMERKNQHQMDIARETAVQAQEARNSELNLIQAKQKLEDTREVEKVKATAAEELEQYKQAVQPLLNLAKSLQELQTPHVTD